MVGVIGLGAHLRQHRTKATAENTSWIVQFLYFSGMVTPGVIGIFYPGLNHFDELISLPPLPFQPIPIGLGAV